LHASQIRILVVDDDHSVRSTTSILLSTVGYKVAVASDGFQALIQMKVAKPDLVISDLNMPHMSGFELLSVVRRRYPEVLVIATSGAYERGVSDPSDVIADAFYPKGSGHPAELLRLVRQLLEEPVPAVTRKSAPVWIPRITEDSSQAAYAVLTCTICLRTFPVSLDEQAAQSVRVAECSFCAHENSFVIDLTIPPITNGAPSSARSAGA